MSNLQNVTLHYFPLNARSAVAKALLSYGKVPFTNNVIQFSEWPQLKNSGKFEFGQLPLLEANGNIYSQSNAINIYLARQLNLIPSDPEAENIVFTLLTSADDFGNKFSNWAFAMSPENKANLEANKEAFANQWAPYFLKIYENRLQKSGGKYFVGDSITLADIWATVSFFNVFLHPSRREQFEPIFRDNAPTLYKLVLSIHDNELADFFSNYFFNEAPI